MLKIFQSLGFTKSNYHDVKEQKSLLMQEEMKAFHARENALVEGLAAIRQCKADLTSAIAENTKLHDKRDQNISEGIVVQMNSQGLQMPASILDVLRKLHMILKEIASEPPILKPRDTLMMHSNIKLWSEQIEYIKALAEQLLLATYEFISERKNSINYNVCELSPQASSNAIFWELNRQVTLKPLGAQKQTKPISLSAKASIKPAPNKTSILLNNFLLLLKFKFFPLENSIILWMLLLNRTCNKQKYINNLNTPKQFHFILESQNTKLFKLN